MTAKDEELVSAVQSVVRQENMQLAECIAECLAMVVNPLIARIAELEKSAGLLVDHAHFTEKYMGAAMNPAAFEDE